MIQPGRETYEIRAALPASLDAAEGFVRRTRLIWEQSNAHHNFAAELLLREMLTNAVVHGCRKDSSQCVRCVLRLREARLSFAVQDSGPGFDWRAAWQRQSHAADCSGRGLEILRKYASRFRFNEPGNGVVVAVHFG